MRIERETKGINELGKKISAIDFLPYDEYVKIKKAVENKVDFDYKKLVNKKFEVWFNSSRASCDWNNSDVKDGNYLFSNYFSIIKGNYSGNGFSSSIKEANEFLQSYELTLSFIDQSMSRYVGSDYEKQTQASINLIQIEQENKAEQISLFQSPPPTPKMATSKEDVLSVFEIYKEYLLSLNQSGNWHDFLDMSVRVYKHNFINQVMIYGQFPDAKYVADIEAWKKVNRGLRKDAVAIATIKKNKSNLEISHIYDISQTLGFNFENAIDVKRFELTELESTLLLNKLCDIFSIKDTDLNNVIVQMTKATVKTVLADGIPELHSFVSDSVEYVIKNKLGLQCDKFFGTILNVNDVDVLRKIGLAVQKSSLHILNELEQYIIEIRREQHDISKRERHISSGSDIGRENSIEQVWSTVTTIPRGRTRGQVLSTIDRGIIDGESQGARGTVGQHEIEHDGIVGSEKPSSDNRRFIEGGTSHERVGDASRGNDERGNIQANLINFNYDKDLKTNYGGSKTKFKANIEAIRLLKQLEADDRLATADEQQILSKYTGFGGISKAFDNEAQDWTSEYTELKELLTQEEYTSARASTLTAFYTPPEIIRAMYDGVMELGYNTDIKMLDPAFGTGNFHGALPFQLKNSNVHGIELDALTGRMAKQLYQKANIQIKGYQDAILKDNDYDLLIGNIPFGNYRIFDSRYVELSPLIHDYFFMKSIDKVKSNGLIAYITSNGTLDKVDNKIREHIAKHTNLIGAVRLPNTAFKDIGGTEVTSDIIFLQKRERPLEADFPSWIDIGENEIGVPVNQYYVEHPENLLGQMVYESSQFGQTAVLKPFGEDFNLYNELNNRITNMVQEYVQTHGKLSPSIFNEDEISTELPADPNVKNNTYTIIDKKIYYRTHNAMELKTFSKNITSKIYGMHEIRQIVRDIINMQLSYYQEDDLKLLQQKLNSSYDKFIQNHGYINDKANRKAFKDDSDLPLLLSIETKNENGYIKSSIFNKATIKPVEKFIPSTYSDLITLSMTQKGKLDITFMAKQFNVSEKEVIENLQGKIYINPEKVPSSFFNDLEEYIGLLKVKLEEVTDTTIADYAYTELPKYDCFESADEYLTGNVKNKLDIAKAQAINYPKLFQQNVDALEQAQPVPLTSNEIDFSLGSTWIDVIYYRAFIYEISEAPPWTKAVGNEERKDKLCLTYNSYSTEYTIYNKKLVTGVNVNSTYGTARRNFFEIVQDTLNQQFSNVYDYVPQPDGNNKRVLNIKETQIARQKQELIKNEFKNWIAKDPQRLNDIVNSYNNKFNVYRIRSYDGSNINYEGMTNEITMRPHQSDAVARCLYSGQNVLLGHVVGSGKTFTMAASAMELKRLGIANKSLFVVPNHLTEQWGADFLKLYPTVNILIATKKDFEPLNRKTFIGKIATGSYDAIIIGHSQFEKIPMSDDFMKNEISEHLYELDLVINEMHSSGKARYSIKQMEAVKLSFQNKLAYLDSKKKDDVITFEETGVDHIFVDEAHYYKNCFVFTKMSNIAGVSTTSAQKSFDMLNKAKYITQKNNGRGVVFATGTPISNSMVEMFVLMRYLQKSELERADMTFFDEWASTFGETKSVMELKPEGSGYRMRTRFATFKNLPELMAIFSQVADIKVNEDLDLNIPKMKTGKAIIEVCKPSDYVIAFIKNLAVRAEKIRDGLVKPWDDNMLKVTSEGRAVAIDVRLIDPYAPVYFNSKIYKCCDNIHKIHIEGNENKALQLVFLDTGIMLYDIMKQELIGKGINPDEIAFIHSANTEEQKAKLFEKCRNGEIRVLFGSTSKMGAGTNVQKWLLAIHHIDCPWRPADIEQRDGRGIRQGNMFNEIYIYRYITENTFDAYMWATQENKMKFITQIMTNKSIARTADDIDSAVLDCAEVKTLATGDPRIKQKMQLDNDIYLMQIEKAAYNNERVNLQKMITDLPEKITNCEKLIVNIENDISVYKANKMNDFIMIIDGVHYTERAKAGLALKELFTKRTEERYLCGSFSGLDMYADRDGFKRCIKVDGQHSCFVELGDSELGNISRIENVCAGMGDMKNKADEQLVFLNKQLLHAQNEIHKPFPKEKELKEKFQLQSSLNIALELGQHTNSQIVDDEVSPMQEVKQKQIDLSR